MNNPMAGIDPTGYLSVCDTFIVCTNEQVRDKNFNKQIKLGNSEKVSNGHNKGENKKNNQQNVEDIGAPSTTAKRTGGVAGGYIDQQSTVRNQRLDEYGLDIDGDVAELNGTGDQGLTAFVSNLYMGRQDGTDILSGKLTKADLYNRAEMYGTVASFVPIAQGVKIGYGVYQLNKLPKTLGFTKTAANHMDDTNRYVPMLLMRQGIKGRKGLPDPRGSDAMMYYMRMNKKSIKNNLPTNKLYNLEVLYHRKSNQIMHFKYTEKAIGPLKAVN